MHVVDLEAFRRSWSSQTSRRSAKPEPGYVNLRHIWWLASNCKRRGSRGRRAHGQIRRAAQYTLSGASSTSPHMQNLRDITFFVGFARAAMVETMRSWEAKKMRSPGAQTSRDKLQMSSVDFLFSGEPAKHWSPNLQTSVDGHSGGVRPERPEMTRKPAVRLLPFTWTVRSMRSHVAQGSSAPHAQAECTGTGTSSPWPQFPSQFYGLAQGSSGNAGATGSWGAGR